MSYFYDNKGNHQDSCSGNTIARKNMHDTILKALMDLLK
jgi:hypothetical protein